MNNRASALILGLFVMLVLSVLVSSFLYKNVNDSFMTNRAVDSTRALWVAESGIQDARNNKLNQASVSGSIGGGNYAVDISNILGTNYYHLISVGTVGGVNRTIEAVASARDVDPTKFKYGVESSVDIDFKGSSVVYGETSPDPLPAKYRDENYYKNNSNFSFVDLFSFSSTEIKDMSTIYNNTWPSGTISGLNWVTAPNSNFNGNVYGSGILIVEGDLRVTGTIDFDGIIYVIGELDMAGSSMINGTILAESAATVDTTLTGTCDIKHNTTAITNALDFIKYRSPQVVSWKEIVQ